MQTPAGIVRDAASMNGDKLTDRQPYPRNLSILAKSRTARKAPSRWEKKKGHSWDIHLFPGFSRRGLPFQPVQSASDWAATLELWVSRRGATYLGWHSQVGRGQPPFISKCGYVARSGDRATTKAETVPQLKSQ